MESSQAYSQLCQQRQTSVAKSSIWLMGDFCNENRVRTGREQSYSVRTGRKQSYNSVEIFCNYYLWVVLQYFLIFDTPAYI